MTLPAEILTRFRNVSLARLEMLEAAWTTLLKGEGNTELEAKARHELHTLKGDSRVVGFSDVNMLCHKLEELLAAAQRMSYRVPDDFDLVVTMGIRFMAMLLRKKEGAPLSGIDVEGFVHQIDDVLSEARARSVPPPPLQGAPAEVHAAGLEALDRVSAATQQRLAESATAIFLEQLRSAGRSRERLRAVWRSLAGQISSFYAVSLQDLLARQREATEELARELGKEARVTLELGGVRLRVDAAEAVDTAVLHALRNAVDHGIEDPVARGLACKPPCGQVRVAARAEGGWVEVVVEDDGRGVDLEQVRQRGQALGFLSPEASARATEEELLELLLQAGFSTRTHVSEVSGRGIGLDAVRAALSRIGGSMTISTRHHQGTRLSVRVPQASRRVGALGFPARREGILLAVHESWSVSLGPSDARAIDPLEALDTAREHAEGGGIVLLLERGKHSIAVCAGGPPLPCVVERICPTSDAHPVEVVLVTGGEGAQDRNGGGEGPGEYARGEAKGEDREALLLRPERLAASRPRE